MFRSSPLSFCSESFKRNARKTLSGIKIPPQIAVLSSNRIPRPSYHQPVSLYSPLLIMKSLSLSLSASKTACIFVKVTHFYLGIAVPEEHIHSVAVC